MSLGKSFILLVLTIGATTQAFSQDSFAFRLYFRDPLTKDTIVLDRAYYFTRANDTAKIKVNSTTGICSLPAKGIYKLHSFFSEPALTYSFNGQIADTLNWPKLVYMIGNPHLKKDQSGYYYGETLAHGHVIDYFKKGIKRSEGTFRKGKLIGKLTYYDLDGTIIKIEYDPRDKHR